MPLKDTFFFIHIPKTAGTSFRMSGVDYFGKENCYFDYGSGTHETSVVIQETAYNKPDFYSLETQLRKLDAKFLSGHVPMKRYAALFPLSQSITFLRQPLDQFISHFEHKKRHHDYKGNIQDMLSLPSAPDMQARCLLGVPIEAYGFVGVTERYEESLRVFNHHYNTNFKSIKLNVNPDKKNRPYSLPENLLETFNEKAKASIILHTRANHLLDERIKSLNENYEFVHGGISNITQTHVDGFAFDTKKNRPVKVQLSINGVVQKSATATQDRPALRAVNAPRNGYVGFSFRFKASLKKGDYVCIQVAATNQILFRYVVP